MTGGGWAGLDMLTVATSSGPEVQLGEQERSKVEIGDTLRIARVGGSLSFLFLR